MASIPASAIIQEARASLLQPSRPMTPSLRDQRLSPRTKFLRLSTKKTINLSNLPKEKRSLPPLPPPSPSSTNPLLRPNSSVTTGTTDNSSYQNLLNAIEEWPLVTDPIDHYMSHIHSPIHHFMTADSDVMSRASQGLDSLLSNSSMDSTLRLLSGLCLLQINGSGNVERVCQIVAELTGELLANGDEEEDEDEKLEAVFGDARGIETLLKCMLQNSTLSLNPLLWRVCQRVSCSVVLQKDMVHVGVFTLIDRGLKVTNALDDRDCTKEPLLLHITETLRNLASNGTLMNHFFDSQLIARLIHILSTSSTTGPIYNSIRILSKLSLLQPVQELLVQEEVFESLWSLLSSHHAECQPLVLRVLYILGNLTMSLSPAHGLLSHKANDLLGLVQAYGTDDTVTENRIGLDILIKLIRLLGNLALDGSIRQSLQSDPCIVCLVDLLGDFPSFAILHSANLSQCNKESCPLEREELLLNILATLSNVSFDPEAAELLQRGQAERIVRVCLEVLMEVQSQEELVLESLRVLCNVSRRSPSAREALQETHGQEALVLLVAHGVSHEVVEYASRVLVNVGLSTQLFSLLERHVEGFPRGDTKGAVTDTMGAVTDTKGAVTKGAVTDGAVTILLRGAWLGPLLSNAQ